MNEKVINKQKLLLKKNYVDLSHFKKITVFWMQKNL